ncbi:MAG: helix-turn-helix transcriptional regulator [Pseudomonadota bacterium]
MNQEFLTVPELAELLRIKERKVYDLAASGLVPCTRATGKLLFPQTDIRAWIAQSQSGHRKPRPNVFLGSQDPLLEWALRQSQCGIATFLDGSGDGLERLAGGEGIATGLHIRNPQGDGWNTEAVRGGFTNENVVLLSWAERTRGFVSNSAVAKLTDLPGCKVAGRQHGSGTHRLFEHMAAEAGVTNMEMVGPYHSEQDAVLAVVDGHADVAFGLENMATQFGLVFAPLVTETFDLLVDRGAYFDAPFQRFLAFCRSTTFVDHARQMRGYNVSGLGEVRWNA